MKAVRFAQARILVVDDDRTNVVLLEQLLKRWGYRNVVSTTDSSAVLRLVERSCPDLVLLDLMMPAPNGLEVMSQLRPWTRGQINLPILVLTGDVRPETREAALSAGARDFLTKPIDATEARLRVGNLLRTRELQRVLEGQRDALEHRVQARTQALAYAQREVLERLAIAAEYRDDDAHQHARRVGRNAALLAAELGVASDDVELIRRAAPLHDIGKLAVPDAVLRKPGRLSADEHDLMKSHTVIGHRILGGSSAPVLQLAAEIALMHHERWDGRGYPSGLAGEQIPLAGRLVAVADVFDALTHARPYEDAWPVEAALAELRQESGAQLDPTIVRALPAVGPEKLLAPVEETMAPTAGDQGSEPSTVTTGW